jgi:hypothetical protein
MPALRVSLAIRGILDEAVFMNTNEGLACLIEQIRPCDDAIAVLKSTGNWTEGIGAHRAI